MTGTTQLTIAASLSFIAAFMHLLIIMGGANWYRFFGAGEKMAVLAEEGSLQPAVITLFIAGVLTVFGMYALSGAGMILELPLLKLGLCLITAVYLLRGLAGFILPFVSNHPAVKDNSTTFWIVSSIICCIFAGFYLLGIINSWAQLG